MREYIRYASGLSSLGDVFVAASQRGIVAFEFAAVESDIVGTLRERFPAAQIEEDANGLAATVATLVRLVDHPDRDPGIVLDPRGSDYERQVWDLVRQIPPGATVSYGSIAASLGTPRDARDATAAIAANRLAILVPCHRVLKKDGRISGYRWGSARKRALLARERRSHAPGVIAA